MFGNEDNSVNQKDKIILQENLQEKLILSLSSLEKTLGKILFISMYVQYFDYFLNLIPVLDRHVLLVGDVLVLQIVSVVKDRGTIDCYGIIVAVMRTRRRYSKINLIVDAICTYKSPHRNRCPRRHPPSLRRARARERRWSSSVR